MCVDTCACVIARVYVSMCACVDMCITYGWLRVYVSMCARMCGYMCMCMPVWTRVWTCDCVYMCMCVCACVCMSVKFRNHCMKFDQGQSLVR